MNIERFQKLISFLDQLDESKFNLNSVVKEYDIDDQGHICGTVCCAIGWTPVIFPELVSWRKIDYPDCPDTLTVLSVDVVGYIDVAAKLFDIKEMVAIDLFSPGKTDFDDYHLSRHATPKQLAQRLRNYLKYCEVKQ